MDFLIVVGFLGIFVGLGVYFWAYKEIRERDPNGEEYTTAKVAVDITLVIVLGWISVPFSVYALDRMTPHWKMRYAYFIYDLWKRILPNR